MITEFAIHVAAAVICWLIGWLIGLMAAQNKRQELSAHNQALQTRVDDLEKQLEDEKQQGLQRLEAQKKELSEGFQRLQAEQDRRHMAAIDAQQKRFDDTIQSLRVEVQTATESMLKERQKDFSDTSLKDINNVVNPLKETLESMRKTINDDTQSRTRLGGELKQNLTSLMLHTEQAKQSADELARVFRHGAKVQGDWGEKVLSELLTSQGLQEGVHFDTQQVLRDAQGNIVRTDNGTSLRPDVVLHLDTKREVVIDSKVSLTAFFDYVNAETEEQRAEALSRHIKSIEKHVDELSKKDYASFIKPPKVKMDFVIMFVPHTGAYQTALQAKPALWRNALNSNVYLVDEQTLYAALRIINMTWTQIRQAEKYQELYDTAGEILDRVLAFYNIHQKVGEAIQKASEQHTAAAKKLKDGKQSVVGACNKLMALGANTKQGKELPTLLDISDVEPVETTSEPEGDTTLSA